MKIKISLKFATILIAIFFISILPTTAFAQEKKTFMGICTNCEVIGDFSSFSWGVRGSFGTKEGFGFFLSKPIGEGFSLGIMLGIHSTFGIEPELSFEESVNGTYPAGGLATRFLLPRASIFMQYSFLDKWRAVLQGTSETIVRYTGERDLTTKRQENFASLGIERDFFRAPAKKGRVQFFGGGHITNTSNVFLSLGTRIDY